MCSAGQLSQLLERAEQLLTASERQDEQLASLARRKTALTQASTELSQRLAELENAPKATLPSYEAGSLINSVWLLFDAYRSLSS